MSYRRRHGRRRNPEASVGAVVREAKESFSPGGLKDNIVNGVQIAAGYAGVSAVGSVLNRLGVGGILGRVPAGVLRTLAGYGVKGFSVGLVGILTRVAGLKGDTGANVRNGAKANFGVTVLRDAAGVIPGGGRISAFLGNYFQADGWPAMSGMGDYLNVSMQPTLPPPDYAPTDGIYGRNQDMYGGEGSVFS